MRRRAWALAGVLGALTITACGCASRTDPIIEVQGPAGPRGYAGPSGPQGPAGPGLPISGARLRAQWYSGADGSREFLRTFFDVERLETCQFQNVQGSVRCMPKIGKASYYADPLCTVPILALSESACSSPDDVPRYVHHDTGCGGDSAVYDRGAPIAGQIPIYVSGVGVCYEQLTPLTWRVFETGAPTDLTQFVEAEVMSELTAE